MSTPSSKETDNWMASYKNDGLLDLFIGFAIFFAGLFLWTEMVWMAAIFIPVFLPSFQVGRKRFLEPRIGKLVPSSQKQAQNQKILLSATLLLGVLLLAGIGMFFAFGIFSGPFNDWLRQYFLLIIGAIFAGVWVFAAAMLKLNRFYLYALLTFGALAIAQFTSLPFWLSLVILGVLIVCVGLITLIHFMNEHPILE